MNGRLDPKKLVYGELASAAIAIAFALRVRGREDDQAAAHLLDRLGARALMHLASSVQRDLLEEVSTGAVSYTHLDVYKRQYLW